MTEHLGYVNHDVKAGAAGPATPESGIRSTTLLTNRGPLELDVRRDRNASPLSTRPTVRGAPAPAGRRRLRTVVPLNAKGSRPRPPRPEDLALAVGGDTDSATRGPIVDLAITNLHGGDRRR